MKELKLIVSCLMLVILTSCNSKEEIENRAPGEFTVSINQGGDSKIVTWTEAVDPDGDSVVYDVYFENTKLENDLTTRRAVISERTIGRGGEVKVVAKDPDGATFEATKEIVIF